MDRRQQKTQQAIFKAFDRLLEKKRFEEISIKDIAEEANIGRSTFYSHFETKADLMDAVCSEIFTHVLSTTISTEQSHDFSTSDSNLKNRLIHILYHLKDNGSTIRGVFASGDGLLFLHYFGEYLKEMFNPYVLSLSIQVPNDYLLNHMVTGFAATVNWWLQGGFSPTPERMAEFFMQVNGLVTPTRDVL
ncbi:MAG: TetR/AcrR family transcriptional regulator [Sphaerochaetaceae bacterium]